MKKRLINIKNIIKIPLVLITILALVVNYNTNFDFKKSIIENVYADTTTVYQIYMLDQSDYFVNPNTAPYVGI